MNSIRARLITWLLTSLLLLLAVCAAGFYAYIRRALIQEFDSALAIEARSIASLVEWDGNDLEFDFKPESLPEFFSSRSGAYFQMWLENGTILQRSPSLGKHSLSLRGRAVSSPEFWDLELPGDCDGRAAALIFVPKINMEEKPNSSAMPAARSTVTLMLARDSRRLEHTLETFLGALLAFGIILLIGTALIVWLAINQGLRPLAKMAEKAATIQAASLQTRFAVRELPRELHPIGQALNDLLARLDDAFQRERRFTADAAHEFRTPIAELRTMAEVALTWPDSNESKEKILREVLDISRQMEGLVNALLAIARCEAGRQKSDLEPVDLSMLIQENWKSHESRALERKLDVNFSLEKNLLVKSDTTMILAILGNLFSNAVEYAPEEGMLECRAARKAGGIELIFCNTCQELAAEDIPHLYEPFWRKDTSRTDSSHSGLGMAVVAAFASQLNIQVNAALSEARCLQVTLKFDESIDFH